MILNITKNLVHLQQTVPIKKIRKNNENKRERLLFLTSWSLINKVFEKDLPLEQQQIDVTDFQTR